MNPSEPTPPTENNALSFLLGDLKRGRMMREANETFTTLVAAVRKTGRAGSITISVKVTPATGGDASRVEVQGSVTSKSPAVPAHSGIYFTTENGGVSKNDPDQAEMPFVRALADAAPAPAPAPVAQAAS